MLKTHLAAALSIAFMNLTGSRRRSIFICLTIILLLSGGPSQGQEFTWGTDGHSFVALEEGSVVRYDLQSVTRTVAIPANSLTVDGRPLPVRACYFSADEKKALLYTHSVKVWRLDTRGNYWVYDTETQSLRQLGQSLPASSMMFAKFSPDGTKVAYVSSHNLFVENVAGGPPRQLTFDGTRKLINATFDWAYEEEFACRDGFQWSPDSKQIAFWQIDARAIPDFNMINNTDSVYSSVVPVEYPTAGQDPSAARIGVVSVDGGPARWLALPGDPRQHYLPRMEWNSPTSLFVQQLNRKQNESRTFDCNPSSGAVRQIHSERETAWIDVSTPWQDVYSIEFRHRFQWLNNRQEYLWFSEKDGWNHLYRIDKNGREVLVTPGAFDVMELKAIDESLKLVYFTASPGNATQAYLFKASIDGKGKPEQVTPRDLQGTHDYDISPTGAFAWHTFSNVNTPTAGEFISLPDHKPLNPAQSIASQTRDAVVPSGVEFFRITTEENIELDGWMVKPLNFDPSKKYPIVFLVYGEPAAANALDVFGQSNNPLYVGDMRADGYIYATVDNRGTPSPKGRAWRKSIYRQIGRLKYQRPGAGGKSHDE